MAKTKNPSRSSTAKHDVDASLQTVIATAEKRFGKGMIATLTGAPRTHNFDRQIPSGSVGLDLIIGPMKRLPDGRWQTGYAPARIVEIFGPEGAGKSTFCMQMAANDQAQGGRVAYIDMEHALDPPYCQQLGLNLDELYISQPESGDQAMQLVEMLVKSRAFTLIIVDSVASLVTEAELQGDVTDSHVGRQARLMSQSLKILSAAIGQGKSPTTLVFTNQIREKVGVMFGSPETTPGGRALRFYANLRIELRNIGLIKSPSNEHHAIGQKVRAKTIKNKVAAPHQQVDVPMIWGQGIDKWQELFEHGLATGVIQSSGAWYSFDDLKAQGQNNFVQLLREDAGAAYRLYDRLLAQSLAYRGLEPDGGLLEGYEVRSNPTAIEQFAPVPGDPPECPPEHPPEDRPSPASPVEDLPG